MKSVRLHKDLEDDLKLYAQKHNKSESDVIREALVLYLEENSNKTSYTNDGDYFGNYGSGSTTNSSTYKSRLKDKIREKTTG